MDLLWASSHLPQTTSATNRLLFSSGFAAFAVRDFALKTADNFWEE